MNSRECSLCGSVLVEGEESICMGCQDQAPGDDSPSELHQLLTMLERSGIGHGTRDDHNPVGTAVQIECEDGSCYIVAEFGFDADGKLKTVVCYPGEP